jgi:hypothetical protein
MLRSKLRNQSFFITRSYKAVTEKLVKITSDVEGLKARTEERKIQVRTEVQDTLLFLTNLIVEVKALLSKSS